MFEKKPEFWLILLRKEGNSFYVVVSKRWKNIGQIPNINKRTYKVDLSQPTYVLNHKRFYFIDFESGARYLLEKTIDPTLTPKELDCIISEGIVRDITKGVADSPKDKIIWFCMGLAIGALVCYMIASIYFNDKIEQILKDSIIQEIPEFSMNMLKILRFF